VKRLGRPRRRWECNITVDLGLEESTGLISRSISVSGRLL
jgi:hypothetical protein